MLYKKKKYRIRVCKGFDRFLSFEMREIGRSAGDGNVSGVVLVKDCVAPKSVW